MTIKSSPDPVGDSEGIELLVGVLVAELGVLVAKLGVLVAELEVIAAGPSHKLVSIGISE